MKRQRFIASCKRLIATAALVGTAVVAGASYSEASPPPLQVNLLDNASFETVTTAGVPEPWLGINNWANDEVEVTAVATRSGSAGVTVKTESTSRNPWASQVVEVEERASYDYSVWYKSTDIRDRGVAIKLEFYSGMPLSSSTYVGEAQGTYSKIVTGNWAKYERSVVAPDNAKYVKMYVRLYGRGLVHFDDASFVKTKHASAFKLSTDQVFYYTDQTTGSVQTKLVLDAADYAQHQVDFLVKRQSDGQVIASETNVPAVALTTFSFQPQLMTVKEPYTVELVLKTLANVEVDRNEATVYRFARPAMLPDPNGPMIVDGQPFFPVMGYHVKEADYGKMAEAGINTVQGWVANTTTRVGQLLNNAQAYGLKVMFPLYYGGKIGENAALTTDIVTMYKDHPALLGWMMVDEPQDKYSIEEMTEAYRIIRTIDDKHPVYLTEANPLFAERNGRMTDILSIDSYPFPNKPITEVGDDIRNGVAAVGGNRQVWTILQAFYYPSSTTWTYLPTIDELRNMAYQSIIGGAQAIGYYAYSDPDWYLPDSDLYPGFVAFQDEYSLIQTLAEYSKTAEARNADTEYATWNVAGDVYAVVLNHSNTEQTVSVPLPFTGYTGELLYGAATAPVSGLIASLPVTIGAHEAYVYKLSSFVQTAQRAAHVVQDTSGASANNAWVEGIHNVLQALSGVENALTSENQHGNSNNGKGKGKGNGNGNGNVNGNGYGTGVTAALQHAAEAVKQLDALLAWLPGSSVANKEEVAVSLQHARALAEQIIVSQVTIEIQFDAEALYRGELAEVTYVVTNHGSASLTGVVLQAVWPSGIAAPAWSQTLPTVAAQASVTLVQSWTVAGGYTGTAAQVDANVSFVFAGAAVQTNRSVTWSVSSLLTAKLNTSSVLAKTSGKYPFELQLANQSGTEQHLSLQTSSASGLAMQLPTSAQVGPYGRLVVNGTVDVGESLPRGGYPVTISVYKGTGFVETLTLHVRVDRNILTSGGFETAGSWAYGKGARVTDVVYEGQYAATLFPEPANTSNQLYTATSIPVGANASFTFSGWAKSNATTGLAWFGVREMNANDVTVRYTWIEVPAQTDWTRYERSITLSPNTAKLRVYAKLDQSANGQAWFDDFYLELNP
jgi:hypothetical protein